MISDESTCSLEIMRRDTIRAKASGSLSNTHAGPRHTPVARPYPAVTFHVGVNGGPLFLRATSGRPPLHVTRSAAAKMRTRRGLGATETGDHGQAMLARSAL